MGNESTNWARTGEPACGNSDTDLYLDGELAPSAEAELFQHLAICRTCRDHFNAVLTFRRSSREERVEVPPYADDQLFERIERRRILAVRGKKLHRSAPLWLWNTTLSVRAMLLAVGLIFFSGLLISDHSVEPAVVGYVSAEQERVSFESPGPNDDRHVYVFYPGVIVEAEREAF